MTLSSELSFLFSIVLSVFSEPSVHIKVSVLICKRYAHDEEAADDQEETGWKYIHGDVFRFPKYKSLFAAALGCGTQLFIM